ncbi:MAG: CotH kinase family protein [Defluviitaleaceae bacterium]|nr:CotH kinase family protein [Defluviitaleaceae bacterium]
MKKTIVLLITAVLALTTTIFAYTPHENMDGLQHETATLATYNTLPSIFVDTSAELWENRYVWQDGTLTIIGYLHNEQAQFRGRGNSTWELWRHYKIPFNFRVPQPVHIAGFENPGVSFILLANHIDRSLMRNFNALYLANLMYGMNFAPEVKPVQVYINGEYQGVYLLTEHRVPARLQADYVIELMMGAPDRGGEVYIDWFEANERYYLIRDSQNNTVEAGMALADFVSRASYAIRSGNFAEIEQYFYIPALVDFYVVQELFASSDAGMFSVWMQIRNDGDRQLIHMGPVWDFDAAAGIINHVSFLPQFENPWVHLPEGLAVAELNYWYRELVQIPEFNELLVPRLRYLVDYSLPRTLDKMWYYVNEYRSSFERNFYIHSAGPGDWSVYSLPALTYHIDTFYEHIVFLDDFLETRALWLYNFFQSGTPTLVWP